MEGDSLLKFRSICRLNGLDVTDQQLRKLEEYVQLLQDWNAKVNLVSRSEKRDIWLGHILHSISPLFLFRVQPDLRVLDLGTGGGLPGIPLAILRGDLKITLLDSIRKKISAVQDILARLQLSHVDAIVSRAEDLPKVPGFQHFDVVLARAVGPLLNLMKWSEPLLTGRMVTDDAPPSAREALPIPCLVAYKGGDLTDEVRVSRRRFTNASVKIHDVVFEGSIEIDLTNKKLVIVQFNQKSVIAAP